jgi:hypothetical protein
MKTRGDLVEAVVSEAVAFVASNRIVGFVPLVYPPPSLLFTAVDALNDYDRQVKESDGAYCRRVVDATSQYLAGMIEREELERIVNTREVVEA